MEPFTWNFVFYFLVALTFIRPSESLKCLDCVGRNCTGSFCEGDYCVLSHYAPRWGFLELGESRVVKGCMSGTMLQNGIRNHCEAADENGTEVFNCFCSNEDYCNRESSLEKFEIQPFNLVICICEGSHCRGKTCIGELCSYVVNQKTSKIERGCVNASVPLIERRSAGACMIPPITGAMHRTVAMNLEELLVTESCVCGTDYCNSEKPKITVRKTMKCMVSARMELFGIKVALGNITCTGEYCFKASIRSGVGYKLDYATMGCASFIDDASLAEELNPIGCAKFQSMVEAEACFTTNDKRAIARASASKEATTLQKKFNTKFTMRIAMSEKEIGPSVRPDP